MAWLPTDYGKGPGEIAAAYQVPVHAVPHYTPLRNQWLDAIKQIAPQIADYIKRKKSDEIANQLLQLEHAPQELQGKGQLGLHGAQLFQQYQQDQEANRPDTEMDNEQWLRLHRANHPEEYPNQGRPMTQYQQEHLDLMRQREGNRRPARQDKFLGLTPGELDAPNYVKFYDAGGNPVSTEQADASPSTTTVGAPRWKESVGYEQYKSGLGAFRAEQDRMKARVSTTNLPPEGVSGSISRPPDQGGVDQAKERLQSESLTAPTPQDQGAPRGMTKADYDAMPSGTVYTAPDGTRRVKK